MDEASRARDEEADIEMIARESQQNLRTSDETAHEVAEDVVDREIPAPSSERIEEERIRRANPGE